MRCLLLILLLFIPNVVSAMDVHVAAAASLREFMAAAAERFEERYPEHRVLVNAASSGTLARQIAEGAPADLFLSANPEWVDYLVKLGKVDADQVKFFAGNKLVVVGKGRALDTISELSGLQRLAIGNPGTTPVGRYAMQMLEQAGLKNEFETSGRLVFAKDVRQALLYAEQGAVSGAIVYASDVRLLKDAKVLLVPGANLQPEVRYPMTLTSAGQDNKAAGLLFAWLTSSAGGELLKNYGFMCLLGSECEV